jgi:uncharacterized protein YndB with AHSA1/START domain
MSASAGKTMTDELMIVREIDAPIALVWKAWTDPGMMKLWSAPKGFTIRENQGEFRPGGEWRSTMHTPEGKDLQLGGEYREIREPNRLMFTHSWYDETGKPGPETLVTVSLKQLDGKTVMDFRQTGFESQESRDGHKDGWTQCFEKLEELLAGKTA